MDASTCQALQVRLHTHAGNARILKKGTTKNED